MKKQQLANINMNRLVLNFLEENIKTVKKEPLFYKHYEGLHINITSMENIAVRLSINKTGITDNKKSIRMMLEDQTLTMAAVISSIALEQNDLELYKRVQCNESTFKNKTDNDLLVFSENLVTEATLLTPVLAEYSIDAATIDDYEKLVAEFKAKYSAPEMASRSNKALGEDLKILLRQNRFIHDKKMKPLARLFKKEHPEFYAQYRSLLRLRDPKTNHSQAAGIITDKRNGKALRDVVIKTEGAVWIATSNRNGKFRLVIPEAGIYTIIFEKEGYQTVKISGAEIQVGRILELEVVMQPL